MNLEKCVKCDIDDWMIYQNNGETIQQCLSCNNIIKWDNKK